MSLGGTFGYLMWRGRGIAGWRPSGELVSRRSGPVMTKDAALKWSETTASPSLVGAIAVVIGSCVLGLSGVMAVPLVAGAVYISIAASSFIISRDILPALSLWLLVLIPVGYMDISRLLGRYFTPAVIVIAVWMIRVALADRPLAKRVPARGWLIIFPAAALLFASTVLSDVDYDRSLGWLFVLAVCCVVPAILGQTSVDEVWPRIRKTFAGVGVFLGVVAAAEYLLQVNPWVGALRSAVSEQAFSFVRAKTSLGHPLITSTVACVALVVCVFSTGRGRQWKYMVGAAGALVALALAVSRSGAIALTVATGLGLLAVVVRRTSFVQPGPRSWKSVLVPALCLAIVLSSPLLGERTHTSGAQQSASYRFAVLDNSLRIIADHPFFGVGPGSSDAIYIERFGGGIESSVLQLLISVGIPAFLLFVVGLGAVAGVAIKRSRLSIAAGLTAFFVAISGFNAINSNPGLLALAAPLIFCAVQPVREADRPS